MQWRELCTIHWRVEAAPLQKLLPGGLTLDRYDGAAWLSVVSFRMTGIHLRSAPVVWGFQDVPEINLRTYVRAGSSRGIYFFSLDANSPLVVAAARLVTGLPYRMARITADEAGPEMRFTSERLGARAGVGAFAARFAASGEARFAAPGSLEAFLHERYRFFLKRAGRLWSGEVRHEPWLLHEARIEIETNTLGSLANEPLATAPERCWFARELDVFAGAVTPFASPSAAVVAPANMTRTSVASADPNGDRGPSRNTGR